MEKDKTFRRTAYAIMLICSIEMLVVGYMFWSAPQLPPVITSYSSEADLIKQAKRIIDTNFREFPSATRDFANTFYWAEDYCEKIITHKYRSIEENLENYNKLAAKINRFFPHIFAWMLSVFGVCTIASVFILRNKYVLGAATTVVLASLSPLTMGSFIPFYSEHFLYWTIPSLALACIPIISKALAYLYSPVPNISSPGSIDPSDSPAKPSTPSAAGCIVVTIMAIAGGIALVGSLTSGRAKEFQGIAITAGVLFVFSIFFRLLIMLFRHLRRSPKEK